MKKISILILVLVALTLEFELGKGWAKKIESQLRKTDQINQYLLKKGSRQIKI